MDDLAFGLQLTVVGMGIVFGVLALLWLLMALGGRLDRRGPGAPPPTPAAGASPAVERGAAETGGEVRLHLSGASDLDERLVAAVAVAVLRHAEARRLQAAPAMRSYWPGSLLFASRWVAAGRTRQGQSWRRRR